MMRRFFTRTHHRAAARCLQRDGSSVRMAGLVTSERDA